jgi:hypothetical protein
MHFTSNAIHSLPIGERSTLNRKDAAEYASIRPAHFKKLVRKGTMPSPLIADLRTCRRHKVLLDLTLDHATNISRSHMSAPARFADWKNARRYPTGVEE